ncbi:WGR domain-containing protein, partial [Acinetobacter baumannii]
SIEPTLFGEICLIRRWGRIGTHGQTKTMCFSSNSEAAAQFAEIHRQKTRRGYRPRPIGAG